jgi:hypothetical protein
MYNLCDNSCHCLQCMWKIQVHVETSKCFYNFCPNIIWLFTVYVIVPGYYKKSG